MKSIINGKMYNTETATEVATYRNGRSYSDFLYVEETLYRKKQGNFSYLDVVDLLQNILDPVGVMPEPELTLLFHFPKMR